VKLVPSVLLAEENVSVCADVKSGLQRNRPTWPVFRVSNGDHALAYLRGVARFAGQVKTPVATLLLMSITLPQVSAFQILDWIRRQPLLRSIVIGLLCSAGDIPEFDESSRHSAHALIQRPIETTQLLSLVSALEHGAADAEPITECIKPLLTLQPISRLKTQMGSARPTLSSDLVLLTNSPPV
jgi:CheY-like chemotaxis protein